MSVKYSTVSFVSNAVVEVRTNCRERTLSSSRMVLSKKNSIIVTEVVLISCSLTVGFKQKIKMKTRNIMVSSYPLKVSSTQNEVVQFFSC